MVGESLTKAQVEAGIILQISIREMEKFSIANQC